MGLSIHISKIDLQGGIFSLKKPSEFMNFMKAHENSCPDRSHDSYHPKNGRELMDRRQKLALQANLNVAFNGQIVTS